MKSFLRSQFQKWYTEEVAQQLSSSTSDVNGIKTIDLSTARMKSTSAQWNVRMFDHLCSSPDIIGNGFKDIAHSIDAGEPVLDDLVSCMQSESEDDMMSSDASTDVEGCYFSNTED